MKEEDKRGKKQKPKAKTKKKLNKKQNACRIERRPAGL